MFDKKKSIQNNSLGAHSLLNLMQVYSTWWELGLGLEDCPVKCAKVRFLNIDSINGGSNEKCWFGLLVI